MMSNFLIKGALAFILATFLTWAYLFIPQIYFSLNNNLRDFLFNIRGELSQSNQVVIVDIDEKSLKQYGQWPWSRSVVADLLNKLNDANVGIIGLDIVFAEADQTSPHRIASKIEGNTAELDNYDLILAETLATTPTVGGYVFTFEENDQENAPLIPAVFLEKGLQENNSIIQPKGVVLNIDTLQKKFYSSGFFNNIPDEGGMIRRVPLVMRYDSVIYPSLVLEMLRIYSGTSKVNLLGDNVGLKQIQLGDLTIPTDHAGRLIINFRGARKHFNYISAADIVNGDFNTKDIAGKFVLIGTSSVGLSDLRSIPFDIGIPGVEVHANTLDNILKGDFLYESADVVLYDIVIIWGIVFLLMFSFSYVGSWLLLPVAIGVGFALFYSFFSLLFTQGVVLNLLFPLIAFVATLIFSVSIDYIITSRQRETVKRMFAKKVSTAVMDDLLKHDNEDILKVRDETVAIFFSDIRGFTQISETIGSSQKLVALLNRYMTPMVNAIANREGTVDKFIGDAIMAYWNAPNQVENYSDKAVSTALEQMRILKDLNVELEEEFGISLDIGISVHTGLVTVGEMGTIGRSDYTIIGDNVNLASRLEGLNKLYGTHIIISEETKNQLQDDYFIRSLDIVRVKGKKNVVEIFEVILEEDGVKYADEYKRYEDALIMYRGGKIKQAHAVFDTLNEEHTSKLYTLYLQRCQAYFDNPKKAFDIISTMLEK